MTAPQRLVISEIMSGLQTFEKPFFINNDSFQIIINALCHRKSLRKRPGDRQLGRLQRTITSSSILANPIMTLNGSGSGTANLISLFGLQANSSIALGSISFTDGTNIFTEPSPPNGYLISNLPAEAITGISQAPSAVVSFAGAPSAAFRIGTIVYITGVTGMTAINNTEFTISALGATSITINFNSSLQPAWISGGSVVVAGTINYATGAVVITGGVGGAPVYGTFGYYPDLPVMGEETFESDSDPTDPIDFPTNVWLDTVYAYQFNGSFFYDVSFYKGTNAPVTWSGANYQQFNSCNYYRALWVTNNKPGMQFMNLTNTLAGAKSVLQTAATTVTIGLTGHGLATGDVVFINQVSGTIATGTGPTANQNINGQSGTVTFINANSFTLTVVGANFQAGAVGTGGIAQYMTRSVSGNGDGIRWYDGDPTGASGFGWVNFAPPLDNLQSAATTYLLGCRIIIPFGNRLLAIGTYEATSANAATPVYYGNRIRYCEVTATPFYSFPVPSLPNGTPSTGVEPRAWASTPKGFGGFIDLDTTQRIISAAVTQGSLILGLERQHRRLSITGIETDPFSLQTINPDYGSAGTSAIIPMDKGILTAGEYGFLIASSYDVQRIDEKIIQQIFQVSQNQNGYERICAARDFVNEVVYFTYYSNTADRSNIYPDTTVVYNYREGSFAVWYESYTTYGIYKKTTQDTWPTYTIPWENWFTPWEQLGADRSAQPIVIGGTPQGFIMEKWQQDSGNEPSMWIQSIVSAGDGTYNITSPNHNLYSGAFIGFWATVGSQELPNFNASVNSVSSINIFNVTFGPTVTLTQIASIVPGIWQMSILDQFNIWTKELQLGWSAGRKSRIGTQKYFLDKTSDGSFTVSIYGSQSQISLNNPNTNNAIETNIVRTSPDDSLGIFTSGNQDQIWHRISSSAIGDTIQLQFTLSEDQMLNINESTAPWVMYSTVLDFYPSRILS